MIKARILAAIAFFSVLFAACDDNSETIGNSLTNNVDRFDVITDTFQVNTSSYIVDSVLSRSLYNYIGHIKDPETNSYVKSGYTTQFAIVENFDNISQFPDKDSIASLNDKGEIIADSCILSIYFYSSIGDSLNPMKLTLHELAKPVADGRAYYTDFDPEEEGLIRNDSKAIRKNKSYTVVDLNLPDSARSLIVNKTNMENISISLNDEYCDKDGKTYENYGTYLLRKYYENPNNFKNSYNFVNNVCPGFYIKSTGGLGVMSEVYMTELLVYYRFTLNDTIYNGSKLFSGTEEVMQTTNISNDKNSIQSLAADNTCTYMKTPAGIFTEVELPIDDIKANHELDTISSAKIVFTHYSKDEKSNISIPKSVMMLPKDSLHSFFENKELPNNRTSYVANYNSTLNTYTFNNISGLISTMYNSRMAGKASKDWNKVLLVPVTITQNTSSSSASIVNVSNDMSLKSVKLIGGKNNTHRPITISVIYNRFRKE